MTVVIIWLGVFVAIIVSHVLDNMYGHCSTAWCRGGLCQKREHNVVQVRLPKARVVKRWR